MHNVTTMVRALARAAVAAALTSLLMACGVGAEDSPEPLEPSMVPPAPTPTVTVVADLPDRSDTPTTAPAAVPERSPSASSAPGTARSASTTGPSPASAAPPR